MFFSRISTFGQLHMCTHACIARSRSTTTRCKDLHLAVLLEDHSALFGRRLVRASEGGPAAGGWVPGGGGAGGRGCCTTVATHYCTQHNIAGQSALAVVRVCRVLRLVIHQPQARTHPSITRCGRARAHGSLAPPDGQAVVRRVAVSFLQPCAAATHAHTHTHTHTRARALTSSKNIRVAPSM
jgi:hypothetical protein